jgi:ribosomal protein S18 acetylase RimI-like enzyme
MTHAHVHVAAMIHKLVLPDDLLSRLGAPFMERYLYSKVVESPWAIGYVYIYNNQVVGYITGTINSFAFYQYEWAELLTMPSVLLPNLLHHPGLIRDLVEAFEFSRVKSKLSFIESEIPSVGVLPEYRSVNFYRIHKLNIAMELNYQLMRGLRSRGVKELFGVFHSENALALVSYQNLGFTIRHEFIFHGSRRLVMGCDLNSERLVRLLEKKACEHVY